MEEGKQFFKLTFIRKAQIRIGVCRAWIMRCDCGTIGEYSHMPIIAGKIKCCGCTYRDLGFEENARKERRALRNAVGRCHNPKDKDYKNYGARGISVHSIWRASSDEFLFHIGPKPTAEHTLDRIETDGNYEPGNVRWATVSDQNKTKRNIRKVEVDGVVRAVTDLCNEHGISIHNFNGRQYHSGMTVEEALSGSRPRGKTIPKSVRVVTGEIV